MLKRHLIATHVHDARQRVNFDARFVQCIFHKLSDLVAHPGDNFVTHLNNENARFALECSSPNRIEQKVGHFSIGTLYTFTALKNNDNTVRLGNIPGTTPATNPFISAPATTAGTDFKRSFSKFAFHSIRAVASYRF